VHTHIRLLASTGGCELFGAQIANDDSRAFAFLRKHLPAFDTRQSALGAAGITAGRRLADVRPNGDRRTAQALWPVGARAQQPAMRGN